MTLQVRVTATGRGKKRLLPVGPALAAPTLLGRVPRVARMLALAHHWQGLIRIGVADDQAALAGLIGVSRPRVTQVMDLLRLAPDIQEAVLDRARVETGRDPLRECDLWRVAAEPLWADQRQMWHCSARRPVR